MPTRPGAVSVGVGSDYETVRLTLNGPDFGLMKELMPREAVQLAHRILREAVILL
jgi:hypothetical protein